MKIKKIRKFSFLFSTISYIITILLFFICKKLDIISGPLIFIANFFLVIGVVSAIILNLTFYFNYSEPLSEEEMEELLELIESK